MDQEQGLVNDDLSLPVVLTEPHTTEAIVPSKRAQVENKKSMANSPLDTEEAGQSGRPSCSSAGKPVKNGHNRSAPTASNVKGFM